MHKGAVHTSEVKRVPVVVVGADEVRVLVVRPAAAAAAAATAVAVRGGGAPRLLPRRGRRRRRVSGPRLAVCGGRRWAAAPPHPTGWSQHSRLF